jgi:Fe-Mn family superoxide dismutase
MLTTRRQALKTLTAAAIASTALGRFPSEAQTAPAAKPPAPAPAASAPPTGPFTLPPLPYPYETLEPYIDTVTMHLHHDRHHQAYVNKLNEAVAKYPSVAKITDVDALLKNLRTVPEPIRIAVRNNGGGHSNHSLWWQTLSGTPSEPTGAFAKALQTELGGLDAFKKAATEAGMGLFGSGWVWLVLDARKKMSLITLPNQDSPLLDGHYPLFGIDIWEHAYYLVYHNLRATYIAAVWNVVNWSFISDRYDKALKA